jgi:hypothetical protein
MYLIFALLLSCTTNPKPTDNVVLERPPTEEVEVVEENEPTDTPEEEQEVEEELVDTAACDTATEDTAPADPITWTECSYVIGDHI